MSATDPSKQVDTGVKEPACLSSDSESTDQTSATGVPIRRSKTTCKKRTIDETLLPPEEAKKLEMRRAYNRECASRARKRTKGLIQQLQAEVCDLQQDKAELRKQLSVTQTQLQIIEKQYRGLLLKNALIMQRASAIGAPLNPVLSRGSLPGLQMASLISEVSPIGADLGKQSLSGSLHRQL